jgi:hypothetical protein
MFLTYDFACTCALSSFERDVVNMGTIQVRKHMACNFCDNSSNFCLISPQTLRLTGMYTE